MKLLITGGHTGIGLELSKLLLADGHELGLVVRNKQRADSVSAELGSNKVAYFYADLSVQSQVVELANQVKQRWGKLDGLFNNAGVLLDDTYYSEQKNEMHHEVNLLAPYILTNLLADILADGFVVNTATGGLHKQKALKLDMLINPTKFVKLLGAYYQSKLAMIMLMNDFAGKHPSIRVLNTDPGALKTKMTANKDAIPFLLKPIVKLFFKEPIEGAKKLYNAPFKQEFAMESGVYITANAVKALKLTLSDEQKAQLLAGIQVDGVSA